MVTIRDCLEDLPVFAAGLNLRRAGLADQGRDLWVDPIEVYPAIGMGQNLWFSIWMGDEY